MPRSNQVAAREAGSGGQIQGSSNWQINTYACCLALRTSARLAAAAHHTPHMLPNGTLSIRTSITVHWQHPTSPVASPGRLPKVRQQTGALPANIVIRRRGPIATYTAKWQSHAARAATDEVLRRTRTHAAPPRSSRSTTKASRPLFVRQPTQRPKGLLCWWGRERPPVWLTGRASINVDRRDPWLSGA